MSTYVVCIDKGERDPEMPLSKHDIVISKMSVENKDSLVFNQLC